MKISEAIIDGLSARETLTEIYTRVSGAIGKPGFYQEVLRLIESGLIPNILICCCGHDCSKCRTFLATLNDDQTIRKLVVEYYESTFGLDLPLEKICCFSGRSDEMMDPCRQCPFLKCCDDRGLSSCAQCSFQPCRQLEEYSKYVNKSNQVD